MVVPHVTSRWPPVIVIVSLAAYGTHDTGEAAKSGENVSWEQRPAQLVEAILIVVVLLDGVEMIEPIDSVLAVELVEELIEVDVASGVSVVDVAALIVTDEDWSTAVEVAKARLEVAASRLASKAVDG